MSNLNPPVSSEITTTQDSPDISQPSAHKSSPLSKFTSNLKNALPGQKKKEEPSPALQAAIKQMEERKAAKIAEMEAEGKDTRALSGSRRDRIAHGPDEGWGPAGAVAGLGGVVQGLG